MPKGGNGSSCGSWSGRQGTSCSCSRSSESVVKEVGPRVAGWVGERKKLRALSTLRGLRGAPAVPSLCRETQSLEQQMLESCSYRRSKESVVKEVGPRVAGWVGERNKLYCSN